MVPETGELTSGELTVPEKASSSMDAVTKGTLQGVELLINIIAMLIVLVALVYLINLILGILPEVGGKPMSRLPPGALSPKSLLIMTYAMCGFANPGSLGIMIGGMGTMAPSRRDEIVALGFRSIIAGTLATCMTGAIVGLIGS